MKYISKLSDKELNRHIRLFLRHIPMYAETLGIHIDQLDSFGKQHQAYAWAIEVEEKLVAYSKDIKILVQKLRSPGSERVSTLYFLDLPRPPVFVARGDIQTAFREMVLIAKNSDNYNQLIGIDLGIDILAR